MRGFILLWSLLWVLLWILLWARPITEEPFLQTIIWNVGQGQMVTVVLPKLCLHFDAGGEKRGFLKKIQRLCGKKKNELHLTHYDRDHINFVTSLTYYLPHLCLKEKVPTSIPQKKKDYFMKTPLCSQQELPSKTLFVPSTFDKNFSRIFLFKNKWLIPGDAPKAQEDKVAHLLNQFPAINYLVVGHHGSNTSTKDSLLRHLPKLKQAIASARKKRYGHPHRDTHERLWQYQVPLITTEEFGHIHVYSY